MRAGQFNRRKPKNLIGGGDRPVNEFNVDFKEQRQLPAPQLSGRRAKQRKRIATMMVIASAFHAAGSGSSRWEKGSQSRSDGSGTGSSHVRGSGRGTGNSRGSGSSSQSCTSRRSSISPRYTGSRVVSNRSRSGRMGLARERSRHRKQRRDERREQMKRRYRKVFAMLFGVILVLGTYASSVESIDSVQDIVPEIPTEAAEQVEILPPFDTEPEPPTEGTTEVPTEMPTEAPMDGPVEQPTEEPTQAPTESPTEQPTDEPTQKPTESPTEEPTEAPVWTWNMDADPPTATVKVDGVGSLWATVTWTDVPAQCAISGTRTYTARAEYLDQVYTDTRTVTLPALGHSFGEAETTTDSEGNIIIRHTCSRCKQSFEIGFQTALE